MHLPSDYKHFTPREGRCRIRIYIPDEDRDAVVVICTELPNNPGASINNTVRRIAAEVIESNRLPTPPVWIEHHPSETTNGRTTALYTRMHLWTNKETGAPRSPGSDLQIRER